MSLLPYALARPLLFGLDAEVAHEVTLHGLAMVQGTPLELAFCSTRVEDPVTLAGLVFPNRVGLAAGLDKNARCIDGLAAMGFGFIEVGTVTPLAQAGNPKPRMFRLPKALALINRLGFNNDGLAAFIANVQRSNVRKMAANLAAPREGSSPPKSSLAPLVLGLNIGKNAATPIENAVDDYLIGLEGVYPHADYVTVNISSPNTKNLRALQSDEALDALMSALAAKRMALIKKHKKKVPIFIKIAPDLDESQVQLIAATLRRYGLDANGRVNNAFGVVATNTTLARDAVAHLKHAQEAGGLSGAPVLAMSNRVISQLRSALGAGFPIIGVGGILSAADAVSKIKAGADVVQIYTGLIYSGPDLVKQSAGLIRRECRQSSSQSKSNPRKP